MEQINIDNIASPLKLISLQFTKIEITNKMKKNEIPQSFTFDHHLDKIDENKVVAAHFTVKITNDDGTFSLFVEMVGEFEIDDTSDLNDTTKRTLFEKNTLSIMFPYMRSEITLLTSQPQMMPIIIPPINIHKFFEMTGGKI